MNQIEVLTKIESLKMQKACNLQSKMKFIGKDDWILTVESVRHTARMVEVVALNAFGEEIREWFYPQTKVEVMA